jgi:hypothetical protein
MKFFITLVVALSIVSLSKGQVPTPTPEPEGTINDPLPGTGTIDFDKAVVWSLANKNTITDVKWTKGTGETFYAVKAELYWRIKTNGMWEDKKLINSNAETLETAAVSPWKNQTVGLSTSGVMVVRISLITSKNGLYYRISKDSAKKLYDRFVPSLVDQPE